LIGLIDKIVEKNFSASNILAQTYENNKKKNMYTPTMSASSTTFAQKNNNKQYNSPEFNKNGFSIPVQPRKNLDYQNNNNSKGASSNENSGNILLKQVESNELRVKRKKFDFY